MVYHHITYVQTLIEYIFNVLKVFISVVKNIWIEIFKMSETDTVS